MHDQLYAFRLHHGLFKDLIDTQYQPVCGTIDGGQLLHGVVIAIVLKNEFRKVAPDKDGRSDSRWCGSERVKYSVMSSSRN